MINFERIKELPTKPGCYLFKNENEKIIYIGKANNLKRRITSYFRKNNDEKRRNFIPQIEYVDILVTDNQKEALIVEQNLIKKHQPRYNVLLKSSNSYPYILITNEKNPRYALAYRVYSQGGEFFGPFPDGSRAREVLSLLERVLPLARCRATRERKPCIYYSIGQCSGYCFKEIDRSYYDKTRKEVTNFFEGRTGNLKDRLTKLFKQNIKNLSFEVAQKQKKVIDSIDFFTTKQHVEFNDRQDYDFLGIFTKNGIFAVNILVYRYGKLALSNGRVFSLEEQFADENEIVQSYIFQFYKQNLPPSVLYSRKELVAKEVFEEELNLKNSVPTTEKTRKVMKIAESNAEER